jgi:hypothetical protein
VATWSRSPSSIDRAKRTHVFILLVVLLRWQEVWQGRGLETGISNKAVLPFSRRLRVSVLRRSAGVKLFVKSPWWWLGGNGEPGETFFNKRLLVLLWCGCCLLLFSPLAKIGGY